MKTITFTDFRKKASGFITEVEHGATLILLRRGKPVAEIIPYSDKPRTHGHLTQDTDHPLSYRPGLMMPQKNFSRSVAGPGNCSNAESQGQIVATHRPK